MSGLTLSILSLLVTLSTWPAFGQEAQIHYTLCKLDKEVRTLRVEKDDDSGKCLTTYGKYGKDQNVGEAVNRSSCIDVLSRVRGTLEKAGWKCRDVQGAQVSDVKPEIR
ncbi:MAG: hypothetical protein KF802_13440 [Bdellovibrionaceae bacterium]|nr:hypothetical protein [Pseudobdellovibrionaceae bacterium]